MKKRKLKKVLKVFRRAIRMLYREAGVAVPTDGFAPEREIPMLIEILQGGRDGRTD